MTPRSLRIALAAAACSGAATLALRAPAEPNVRAAGRECACEVNPGARRHDGFFARSEPGVALLHAVVEGGRETPRRSGVRGIGQSGAVALGGTPLPGFVVGGMAWTARIDPVFVRDGIAVSPDDDSVKLTLLRVGPFVDWYPDPLRGFHALASLALGVAIETDMKGDPLEPEAVGVSLSTGAGYEWFLGGEFSLGFLARFSAGRVARATPGPNESMLFVIPELALSATYH